MQTLREAMLVIPQKDNDGGSLLHLRNAVLKQIVTEFGGATILQSEGMWLDKLEQLYAEPVWLVLIACPVDENSVAALQSYADHIGEFGKQYAVYIRHPDNTVEIRDTAHLWEYKATTVAA